MTFDQKRSLVEALSTELGAGAEPYVVLIDGPSLGLAGLWGASDIPRGRAPPSSGPGPGPTAGRARALDRCLLEDYQRTVSRQKIRQHLKCDHFVLTMTTLRARICRL